MDAQQQDRSHTLTTVVDEERRLLARTIRLARHEPGDEVPTVVLDAVLIGRLPSGYPSPSST
jgi:hypothetical protein